MKKERIDKLREFSRKLVRELGMLQLSKGSETPPHWHALIEISREPEITTSELGKHLLLSTSATSRIVGSLIKHELVSFKGGADRREKNLRLTKKGQAEIKKIDEFSNAKVSGAFELLSHEEQDQIILSIEKYGNALERSRLVPEQVKIHTLSTSRAIRKQIVSLIAGIQVEEFLVPINSETNSGILRAEEEYYYNRSYNFWYAVDNSGKVIGSIGLKKLNEHEAEIKKFFVAKAYRGKGIAQKLITTLLKAATKHRFKELYLGTIDRLEAACHFYEKSGFLQIPKKQLPPDFKPLHLDNLFFKGSVEAVQMILKSC